MVEMECDRNRERPGHLGPHREEHVGADRFHGLDGRLDDERRAQLLGRGQHRLHRQVVDDVDRGNTIAFRERSLDDLLGRDDRHGSTSCRLRVTLAVSSWIGTGWGIVERRRPSELEDSPGVAFVDDQDIDDAGAQRAEDRERLLDLARDGDNGVDAQQVLDRERDEALAVGGDDAACPRTST